MYKRTYIKMSDKDAHTVLLNYINHSKCMYMAATVQCILQRLCDVL